MMKYKKTAEILKEKIDIQPKFGIVLGSGLSNMKNTIDIKKTISYENIPGFKKTTTEGQKGNLIFGYIKNIPVVAMDGRNHFYEGHSMKDITFPIRVMKYLGVNCLITSNAVGGLNDNYAVGDIVVIRDHINLMGSNPLIGKNNKKLGPRFLIMSDVYDNIMIELSKNYGQKNNIKIHEGVYAALTGPNFETLADYKFLKTIGADTVGMSTIPEVLVAKHMNLAVCSLSVVTNLGTENTISDTSHDSVQDIANIASKKMIEIVKHIVINR